MDKVKTYLELYDTIKDIIYLVTMPHSAFNTAILAATIIAPPILVLSAGDIKFKDLYGIGEYNKTKNAGGVLLVKVLENVPQMVI